MRRDVRHLRRDQVIDATIAVIAKGGFARTTLSLVAREAGLSQGIVSFYFKSKERLLLDTLHHLANEYQTTLNKALRAVGDDPIAGLDTMIEVDLGPDICVRRKVAVWLAFWAEARGRPQYRKVCSELSATYLDLSRRLCAEIAQSGGYEQVEPDWVASGLNAMIDGYWAQLMMDPGSFDRSVAKAACRQFLAGAFPNEFGPLAGHVKGYVNDGLGHLKGA